MLSLSFVPSSGQRVKSARFDLAKLELAGIGTRGTRLAPKPVRSLKNAPPKAKKKRASAKRTPRK